VIVVDTSFLYALLDRRDRRHAESVAWYDTLDDELVTTPMVLAELEHLATTRAGTDAAAAVRHDVRSGAYGVEWWTTAANDASVVAERYDDLGIGLTDASLVALAKRVGTATIATFDERHFRAIRPLTVHPSFTLVPLDA
jgi:predicted nucleic acid-binding protein